MVRQNNIVRLGKPDNKSNNAPTIAKNIADLNGEDWEPI